MPRLSDVILLLALPVSLIVATPSGGVGGAGQQESRLLAMLPGYGDVKTDDAAQWTPYNSRTKRQTESSDDEEAVVHRRAVYLPMSESRQLLSEDGATRWVYLPASKLGDVEEKRKWQGGQMVVWGKRGQRPFPAAAAAEELIPQGNDKRNGAKHKWATAGNMAVWGK